MPQAGRNYTWPRACCSPPTCFSGRCSVEFHVFFFVGACKGSAGFPRGVQRGFCGGVGGVPAGFPRGFPRGFRGFPGGSGGFRKVSARYSKILQILASTRKLHKIYNFLYTYATWPFSTRGFPSATESKYYNTIKVFAAIFGVRPGNMSAH